MSATRERPSAATGDGGLLARFHSFVSRTVPRSAQVLVVSKGDRSLVEIPGVEAGHFPQRGDGVYAGYYPKTSAAAIEHLDQLRTRGAEFIVFPSSALWWLEHYDAFAEHLNQTHQLVALDEDVAALYALFVPGSRAGERLATRRHPPAPRIAQAAEPRTAVQAAVVTPGPSAARTVDEAEVRALFDASHYIAQAGLTNSNTEAALSHYLAEGHRVGHSPHPLFDVAWYRERHPEVAGENPLVHFVRESRRRPLDPSPFFDSGYYRDLAGPSANLGGTALRHYIERAASNGSYHPNPLFRDGYYLRTYGDARRRGTPLEHYLAVGVHEGRTVSDLHRQMLEQLARSGQPGLLRGNWKSAAVLCFAARRSEHATDLLAVADELSGARHVDATIVAQRRGDLDGRTATTSRLLVLEDFELAAPVLRPSARRLLAHALLTLGPLFALCEDTEALATLNRGGLGTYFLLPGAPDLPAREELQTAFAHSTRVIAPSSRAYLRAAEALGRFPTWVATRRPGDHDALLALAERDFGCTLSRVDTSHARSTRTRRLVIPCPDWSVSGVNASLHALGTELEGRGWDVEILFTRDRDWVQRSAAGATLPALPHRFLQRRRPGIEGLWEALIADLESHGPQTVLTAYDFIANGVVPALGDRIGVAMWVQADDGDYYEQAYRLGRYCDAIVCVSDAIAGKLAQLNPALAERTHVIPNSSIRAEDIVAARRPRGERVRIAYTGRLVHYQKRILDFVALSDALTRAAVDHEIVLIGAFPAHTDTEQRFMATAAAALDEGRIRLAGRLGRDEILAELDGSDLFALLSDFEGLPLSLVEAMARGCVPVTAAMDSGIPQIVTAGHNGLVIAGRDYDAWAREIAALTADRRAMARMSQRARATVKRAFTVESAADRFEAMLEQIAARSDDGARRRPAALHWGPQRSVSGDVLPPPSLFRPDAIHIAGLQATRSAQR